MIQTLEEVGLIYTDSDTLLCRDQNVLLLEQLGQRAVLVHRHEDIGSTNELLVDVKLRNGRPLRVFLDSCFPTMSAYASSMVDRHVPTCSELLILKNVEGSELGRVDALQAEDLDACS